MTFVNGILALGALAFSVPLVIHLLFRSRFRTVDWGAMHLLDTVVRINRRRIQLLHLLLWLHLLWHLLLHAWFVMRITVNILRLLQVMLLVGWLMLQMVWLATVVLLWLLRVHILRLAPRHALHMG